MKNYKKESCFAAILVIAFGLFLIPADNNAGTVQSLIPEYLASGSWGPEYDVGMKVKFTRDGKFESDTNYGQDGCSADGTYSIRSGKLSLSMEKSKKDDIFCGVMTLKGGILSADPASPKYRNYILFRKNEVKNLYLEDDLKIWDYNSKLKEGDTLTINGLSVLAMGIKSAVTTAAVKVRETPGINGKEMHFVYDDPYGAYVVQKSDTSDTLKSIKKSFSVTVLARTKEKDKVGKLNNYWYYIEFAIENRGWVFGEFIKIK